MPELPEVEVVRRGLADHVVDRTIARVEVAHPRAVRRHLEGGDDFAARLIGRTVTAARRRGKYLWLELGDARPDAPNAAFAASGPGGDAVLAHLGFAGSLTSVGQVYPRSLDFDVVSALVQSTAGPARPATTLRPTARPELVPEGVADGPGGRSAMPPKMDTRPAQRVGGPAAAAPRAPTP